MKKLLLTGILTGFIYCGFGQKTLRGKVVDSLTGNPLASVSVYLNNTSFGTVTGDDGRFVLRNLPNVQAGLVVTLVGYETYVSQIDLKSYNSDLTIRLHPAAQTLEGFEVLAPDPGGWEKWGKLFTDKFIGTSDYAYSCYLQNPKVLKFRFSEKYNLLVAHASEPLIILNKALGYELKYKLETFSIDFNTKLVSFTGYAFFKDLALGHEGMAKKWKQRRLVAYEGSLNHFMRAFYANRIEEEGFALRNLGNMSNPKKDKAKLLFSQHPDSVLKYVVVQQVQTRKRSDGQIYLESATRIEEDSTDFYKKALMEPDSVISHQLLISDQVGFAVDSTIAGFFFTDSLEVDYLRKGEPKVYKRLSAEYKKDTMQVSQLVFVRKKPVLVLRTGYYYIPDDLKVTGFLAWWETIANLLPYDYRPTDN